MHTSNTENREHDFKPNGFGSDHCLVCGGKVSEHTVDGREQTFDETIPEDSIHPPQSSNPDPAQGLRELVMSNTKQQIKEILTSLDSYYHENLTDDEVLILYPELRKAVDAIDRILRVEAPPVSNGVQSGLCTGCGADGLLYSVMVPLTGRSKLLCYSCRSVFTK